MKNYYYDGTTLIKEETSDYTIIYLYDAFASPIGFKYRATEYESNVWDEYFYEKNLQGDIVGIYNADGVMLVSYVYDAWGNFVTRYHNGGANTTAVNNHFTYRGYYYDSDLGLYYLQSRYYDSNTGRFINADALMSGVTGSLKGYNLFAYCFNNPVAFTDSEGNWPKQLEEKLESFKGWCKDKLCEIDFFDELINADKSNCDVNVVMQADYFAYYEEHLVIKVNAYFYASFNVIIVDRNTDINIFKHEYGHALQYEKLGFKQYLTEIAIPSIVAWGVRENGLLPFEYYSSPWESEANSYGGVKLSDSRRRSWTEADGKYNYLLDLLFK